MPDEVQVLLTLWAQPNIQQQLLTTATNNDVFEYLSSELAFVGFNKTAQQCSLKVTKLKEEYRKIKEVQLIQGINSNWFAILDRVLGPGEETSAEVDSSDVLTRPKSPENAYVKGTILNPTMKGLSVSSRAVTALTRSRPCQQMCCRLFGHQRKWRCCSASGQRRASRSSSR